MSEYRGGFCVALCGDEAAILINNRYKVCIHRNHQAFIDSRMEPLVFLTPKNHSVIMVSEDVIGEFISSAKFSFDSLQCNLKSNEDIFQIECYAQIFLI